MQEKKTCVLDEEEQTLRWSLPTASLTPAGPPQGGREPGYELLIRPGLRLLANSRPQEQEMYKCDSGWTDSRNSETVVGTSSQGPDSTTAWWADRVLTHREQDYSWTRPGGLCVCNTDARCWRDDPEHIIFTIWFLLFTFIKSAQMCLCEWFICSVCVAGATSQPSSCYVTVCYVTVCCTTNTQLHLLKRSVNVFWLLHWTAETFPVNVRNVESNYSYWRILLK